LFFLIYFNKIGVGLAYKINIATGETSMKKNLFFIFAIIFCLSFYFGNNVSAEEPVIQQTLHDLCEFGSFTEVKDAIIAGASVNEKDSEGRTPLMAACQGNSSAEIIQLLLSYGARVNLQDDKGRTALMYAAQYDMYEKVFAELIKAGANLNTKANDGTTALMLACENAPSVKIVNLLIDAGASVNDKDFDGYVALDYAENNKNKDAVKDILRKAGAVKKK